MVGIIQSLEDPCGWHRIASVSAMHLFSKYLEHLLCTRHCAKHWYTWLSIYTQYIYWYTVLISSKTNLVLTPVKHGSLEDAASFMGGHLELDVREALPQWQQLRTADSSAAFPEPFQLF